MTTHHPDTTDPSPSADAEPIVRLVDVHKSFARQPVLKGISFAFPAHQTTVVLGPSGVGKSVILKHIVGLIRPDKGEVWFRDQRIDHLNRRNLDSARRHIGFLFQNAALFDSMTVEQNIAFPLREHTNQTDKAIAHKVTQTLELVELAGLHHKLPTELSGGQRKRVGLARAIVLEPDLILYDEPTTGLDPIRADGINDLILRLRNDLGISSIVVTHDLASTRKIADMILMLHEGQIIAQGTFSQIARSRRPEVRQFLAGHSKPAADTVAQQDWAPR